MFLQLMMLCIIYSVHAQKSRQTECKHSIGPFASYYSYCGIMKACCFINSKWKCIETFGEYDNWYILHKCKFYERSTSYNKIMTTRHLMNTTTLPAYIKTTYNRRQRTTNMNRINIGRNFDKILRSTSYNKIMTTRHLMNTTTLPAYIKTTYNRRQRTRNMNRMNIGRNFDKTLRRNTQSRGFSRYIRSTTGYRYTEYLPSQEENLFRILPAAIVVSMLIFFCKTYTTIKGHGVVQLKNELQHYRIIGLYHANGNAAAGVAYTRTQLKYGADLERLINSTPDCSASLPTVHPPAYEDIINRNKTAIDSYNPTTRTGDVEDRKTHHILNNSTITYLLDDTKYIPTVSPPTYDDILKENAAGIHGVGHTNPLGGGSRNHFGLDFKSSGLSWTPELYRKDSDGDGRTNGEEFGDSGCVWKQGNLPSRLTDITHPGTQLLFKCFQETCKYKSLSRPKTTYFGDGTSDEMCFGLMAFYPAANMPSPLCVALKDISICNMWPQQERKDCKWVDFMYQNVNETMRVRDEVMANCKLFGNCLSEYKATLQVLFAEHPCMKGDVYDLIKEKAIDWDNKEMQRFILAVDSCKAEMSADLYLQNLQNDNRLNEDKSKRTYVFRSKLTIKPTLSRESSRYTSGETGNKIYTYLMDNSYETETNSGTIAAIVVPLAVTISCCLSCCRYYMRNENAKKLKHIRRIQQSRTLQPTNEQLQYRIIGLYHDNGNSAAFIAYPETQIECRNYSRLISFLLHL
ncbi:unnamed protein product [Mytilus coruscus]|uniref:Uncharacterized protein n=1 Tax=Mytilus coruscus TaxID=42192 RepID=A0A6J8APY7_MYTCO|nr:unnamed protein product [Mytilus coruscus]